jgi:uncharacterized membrane protein YqjE
MHPLLHLLVSQPGLLGEHAQAYAELLASELSALKQGAQRRLIWGAAASGLALLGLLFGGVALMLWAALPSLPLAANWVLPATPGVPLLGALACLARWHTLQTAAPFAQLKEQIKADMQLLKEVSAP